MDARHVYMVHDILRGCPWRTVAEVGCLNGASSTAFVEAINAGSDFKGTFCDVDIKDSLSRVLGNCEKPEQIRVTRKRSWDLLATEVFDFVLLDANHDAMSVSMELGALLIKRPVCLMAHDTNASDLGYPKCEGARLLKQVFQQLPDYQCIEDCELRYGERTERGLFLATRDSDVFEIAKAAFAEWKQ
jgi:hypothetical protein